MSKRKSKKIDDATRDAAATLCLLMADRWIAGSGGPMPFVDAEDDMVKVLSHVAWCAACYAMNGMSAVDAELEAAALLLDGWSPGDPVYMRGAP